MSIVDVQRFRGIQPQEIVMSRLGSAAEMRLAKLRDHLRAQRYSTSVAISYVVNARAFLRALECRGGDVEDVLPADVERYLDALKRRRDQQPLPPAWRRAHRAAIAMLLRLVHGRWPPKIEPSTAEEIGVQELVGGYDSWMLQLRGLSASTREQGRREAAFLLRWLRSQGKTLASLNVADLDNYIAWRCTAMRRKSKATLVSTLRGVLRHLHGTGHLPLDLSSAIEGPHIYALEDIPSTIRREDIDRAVQTARHDRSPLGRRDYAIMMLLATYGLRASEIRGLRLPDIDWRHERLRVRHTKTGIYTELPLMPAVANALLAYLRHGRPETPHREVFIRTKAPYQPLGSAGALYAIVGRSLQAVGVSLKGKRGAHVMRHSRAASLLTGGVPLKIIGDVLGHRSTNSTAIYLKLATNDLSAVALDLPEGMVP
jgi:integrase/recombinase XerD